MKYIIIYSIIINSCVYMQVNVPNNCSYNIVTVKCGHCTMVLSMDLSPFHQARIVPDNQVKDSVPATHADNMKVFPRKYDIILILTLFS